MMSGVQLYVQACMPLSLSATRLSGSVQASATHVNTMYASIRDLFPSNYFPLIVFFCPGSLRFTP